MASIGLTDITKHYPGATSAALRGVSLDIEDGEFMVVVGPSGCGKSTLLRLIAGLESADSGGIEIGGQRVDTWSPQKRNIAMVFQNYALYPHMSVRRNLEFPLRLNKLSRPEVARRVEETAELLNLSEMLERRPGQLSGGERQRVAMGRALVRKPSVFLMDEPLSNLDAKLRVQIRTEIAALQQRMNITTVYVTHDQTEAMTLGHRVAVMSGGHMQQVDAPLALYDQPANVFVAGFIGSPGMNIFNARFTDIDQDRRMFVIDGQEAATWSRTDRSIAVANGEHFLAGIRPESLTLPDSDVAANGKIRLQVKSTETIGHEKLVYCTLPNGVGNIGENGLIVARVPVYRSIRPGEFVEFGFSLEQVNFFDRQGTVIPCR